MTLDTLLTEARGWLADCGLRVPEDDVHLALKVDREYDGGWEGFVAADGSILPQEIFDEVKSKFPQPVFETLYPAPDPTPTGDPKLLVL